MQEEQHEDTQTKRNFFVRTARKVKEQSGNLMWAGLYSVTAITGVLAVKELRNIRRDTRETADYTYKLYQDNMLLRYDEGIFDSPEAL